MTPYSAYKQTQLIRSDEGLTLETSDFKLTTVAYFTLSTHFMVPNYLCSLSHFHEIHLYTCSCTIPGYCYTQHSHHSCVFRQHIRPSLENQKRSIFCTEPVFMFLSRVLWCCCFPFVCFSRFLGCYSQLLYSNFLVTTFPCNSIFRISTDTQPTIPLFALTKD